jgi:hypothetical protein
VTAANFTRARSANSAVGVGIDFSPAMLEQTRARHPPARRIANAASEFENAAALWDEKAQTSVIVLIENRISLDPALALTRYLMRECAQRNLCAATAFCPSCWPRRFLHGLFIAIRALVWIVSEAGHRNDGCPGSLSQTYLRNVMTVIGIIGSRSMGSRTIRTSASSG